MDRMQTIVRKEPAYRPSVLLVEDEFTVAKGLQMVMNDGGYEVDMTDSGKGALDKFRSRDFDLVVADLRLPDIDGMEVIQRVREKRPDTKVVIITGYPSVSTAVQAVKMGVSDYPPKPFTDDEFMAAVEEAVSYRAKGSTRSPVTETQKEQLIQRQEVIRVLERAHKNNAFWCDLMENGSEALRHYRLSYDAKAAIISGDLNWIQENVGELTEEQLVFMHRRLEREAW